MQTGFLNRAPELQGEEKFSASKSQKLDPSMMGGGQKHSEIIWRKTHQVSVWGLYLDLFHFNLKETHNTINLHPYLYTT